MCGWTFSFPSGPHHGWQLSEGASKRHIQFSRPEPLAESQPQGVEHPDDPRERLLRPEDPQGDQPGGQQPQLPPPSGLSGQRWIANIASRRQQHCQVTITHLMFQAIRGYGAERHFHQKIWDERSSDTPCHEIQFWQILSNFHFCDGFIERLTAALHFCRQPSWIPKTSPRPVALDCDDECKDRLVGAHRWVLSN